ncbi:uncharacterized protein LOC112575959 [Pomacea canaliculata]|uniref:uncharacterized protein LOC112575959 n=1 Tax=Pomacea canaliculata TaxID=400727 RepID=UPI000D726484|nr:uncharacterized protein LOC112575959 [Pomacea canaliculata]
MDFKTNGIVIASLLVSMVASSSVHRLKRETVGPNPLCQGRSGDFSVADDCSKFVNCWEGYGKVLDCTAGLVFEERIKACNWPSAENTKNCAYKIARDEDPAIERKLEQIYQICSQLPVLANATLVAHPDFCNAYVVCGNGVATTPCEVCSVGTYFPDTADRCVRYEGELECTGKRAVQFNDLTGVRARDANCNPVGSRQPLPRPTPEY